MSIDLFKAGKLAGFGLGVLVFVVMWGAM